MVQIDDLPRQNGYAVRGVRQLRGLDVSEVAQKVGISDSHLRNIELEHRSATAEDLARIALALDFPPLGLLRIPEVIRVEAAASHESVTA